MTHLQKRSMMQDTCFETPTKRTRMSAAPMMICPLAPKRDVSRNGPGPVHHAAEATVLPLPSFDAFQSIFMPLPSDLCAVTQPRLKQRKSVLSRIMSCDDHHGDDLYETTGYIPVVKHLSTFKNKKNKLRSSHSLLDLKAEDVSSLSAPPLTKRLCRVASFNALAA